MKRVEFRPSNPFVKIINEKKKKKLRLSEQQELEVKEEGELEENQVMKKVLSILMMKKTGLKSSGNNTDFAGRKK